MWLLRAVIIFQKATESSQGQKISKGNCGVFKFAKNQRKKFLFSFLASKKWLNKKRDTFYSNLGLSNAIEYLNSFDATTF